MKLSHWFPKGEEQNLNPITYKFSAKRFFYLTPKVSLGTQNYYLEKFPVLLLITWVYQ